MLIIWEGREAPCMWKISLGTSARHYAKWTWQKWWGEEQNCWTGLLWLHTCFLQQETFSAGQKEACRGLWGEAEPALHGNTSSKDRIQRNRVSDPVLCTASASRYLLLATANQQLLLRPSSPPWRKPWGCPLQVTPGLRADSPWQGKKECPVCSARKYVLNLSVIWLPGSGEIVHGVWDRNISHSWSGWEKAAICVGKLEKWRERKEKWHALVVYAFQTFTNSG